MKNQKGITLIALIITIIVLLILAGVSISLVVGDNGVLTQAQNASKKTTSASEKEAIEFAISDVQVDILTGEEVPKSKYLGKALSKRTLGNTTEWGVVTVDGKNYDNGWYLLEKGNEIEGYGKAKQSWLINYNTGETIELEEGKYSKLSAEDVENQVAKTNLIFNLDSNLIDMAKNEEGEVTKESFESLLDENSELVNFDWNGTTSGVTKTSFKFDGIDDYAKVNYSNESKKEILKNNGFTFEFYGVLSNGKMRFSNSSKDNGLKWSGLFGAGEPEKVEGFPMSFIVGDNNGYPDTIMWRTGTGGFESELSDENYMYNQYLELSDYGIDLDLENGTLIYLTITLDTSKIFKTNGDEEYYKCSFYANNKKLDDFGYNVKGWNYFCENDLTRINFFSLGMVMDYGGCADLFCKLDCYALRLYNKSLSDTEIEQSYNDTVAAHNKLVADESENE